MHIGKEVEGRLKGVLTLFMGAQEALEFFNYKSLKEAVANKEYHSMIDNIRHVYVSDPDNVISPTANCLVMWDSFNMPVTIEVNIFNYNRILYPDNVSFFLNLPTSDFYMLNANDQIKFDIKRSVYTAHVATMQQTNPHEFENDIELYVTRKGTTLV